MQLITSKIFDCQLCCSLIRRFFLLLFLVISPVPFCPVLTCPISHWTAGIFDSAQLSPIQLNSAQLCFALLKPNQNSAKLSSIQLSSAQFSSTQLSSRPFLSSFDLSNPSLDSWYFCLFPFYFKQFCLMLDWTGQN